MADKILMAKQLRRAIQDFIATNVKDEAGMMEFADIYPTWDSLVLEEMTIPAGTVFQWGKNKDGETQLWSFVSDYKPDFSVEPETDSTHYKKIGFTEDGKYPLWSKPYGPEDAYNKNDIVSYDGKLWRSDRDGNIYCPVSNVDAAWEEYEEGSDTPSFPAWSQPDKPENGYKKGTIVEYEGKYWISNVDNNVAVPKDGISEWSVYVSEVK